MSDQSQSLLGRRVSCKFQGLGTIIQEGEDGNVRISFDEAIDKNGEAHARQGDCWRSLKSGAAWTTLLPEAKS